jgi:hypothetical protein
MNKPLLLKLAAALAVMGAIPLAHASEQDGVSCSSGAEAEVSGGVLRCERTRRVELESICSPAAFSAAGVTVNTNITMDPIGRDQCLATVTGQKVPSVMRPPVPGVDPPSGAFRREVNASGPDKFVATQVSFEFPTKLPPYLGDASRGVRCPSGFETAVVNNGRGIRCERSVERRAICDGGFTVDRNPGRDLCTSRDLFGNLVTGQYTIPENAGYVGVMGNPSTHGWALAQDHRGDVDFWIKRQKEFRYPDPR